MSKNIDTFNEFFDVVKWSQTVNPYYKNNLNTETNIKKDFNFSTLCINRDNKLRSCNRIYVDNIEVGTFCIDSFGDFDIDKIGNIKKGDLYKKTLYLQGGFIIKKEYKKSGVGRNVIGKIFNNYEEIDNILLYAVDWQGAVGFWTKIGGEIVFRNEKSGLNLIKINRDNFKKSLN